MSRKGKLIAVLGVPLACLLLLIIFHSQLLSLYAGLFMVSNATPGADAIICLSGDRETRNPECLRLWKEGYAKRLFVTAEKPKNKEFNKLELSHLQFAQAVAKRMQLDAAWELLPSLTDGATSTFDEAADALAMAQREGWERIILVTDEFHTRRASYAFEKIFEGSGIGVEVAGASNEVFSDDDWWRSDWGISSYVLETIKFPVYFFWDWEPTVIRND